MSGSAALRGLEAVVYWCSNIYQHLVSLLVQPPLRSELAGVDLPGGGRLPDLDAAIAILEQVKRVTTLIFLFRLLQCCESGSRSIDLTRINK